MIFDSVVAAALVCQKKEYLFFTSAVVKCRRQVHDHFFGNVPHTVDGDNDLLENWDDDCAGDNRDKDLNSDDSVDPHYTMYLLCKRS
jgi:hypothetical protein